MVSTAATAWEARITRQAEVRRQDRPTRRGKAFPTKEGSADQTQPGTQHGYTCAIHSRAEGNVTQKAEQAVTTGGNTGTEGTTNKARATTQVSEAATFR